MLKIGSVRWRGKCSRHPAFDPGDAGRDAIRGGCPRCGQLAEIQECHARMLSLMRGFAPPRSVRKRADDPAGMQQSLF
ncbi:MAG: hypothetical protein M3N54_09545 [Acidobacteriota bacterium]|nr:hypothetical protein [Acidobacteriota bacterium]